MIEDNKFHWIRQHIGKEFFDMIGKNLTSYYNAMFPGYWDFQQTPLVHITVPEGVNVRNKE